MNFIADHGIWLKKIDCSWELLGQFSTRWKRGVIAFLNGFTTKLPGSLVEEKDYSVVFHYRAAEPEKVSSILPEIKGSLESLLRHSRLEIIQGQMILEIRYSDATKGTAISKFLKNKKWPFILAIGDDRTDEDMFEQLPKGSISVKVGTETTSAKYSLESPDKVLEFLECLVEETTPDEQQ